MLSNSIDSDLERLSGLSHAKRLVSQLAHGPSGVHAVLFYGPAGSGKSELCRCLAKAWLDNGTDKPVRAFERGNNPDVLEVRPSATSDQILVKQIREDENPDKDDPIAVDTFLRSMPLMSDLIGRRGISAWRSSSMPIRAKWRVIASCM